VTDLISSPRVIRETPQEPSAKKSVVTLVGLWRHAGGCGKPQTQAQNNRVRPSHRREDQRRDMKTAAGPNATSRRRDQRKRTKKRFQWKLKKRLFGASKRRRHMTTGEGVLKTAQPCWPPRPPGTLFPPINRRQQVGRSAWPGPAPQRGRQGIRLNFASHQRATTNARLGKKGKSMGGATARSYVALEQQDPASQFFIQEGG